MSPDGVPTPASSAPTPSYTPMHSGVSTPQSGAPVGDYLTVPLHKWGHPKPKMFLGGSKALDSLARLIASTEHFFHPANSGSWTSDVRRSFCWTLFLPSSISSQPSSNISYMSSINVSSLSIHESIALI